MTKVNTRATMQVTRSLAMSSEPSGGLICIRGKHIGHMIVLPADKVMVFGRDPGECNVVMDDNLISRRHCQITYIASIDQYRIMDCSKNGTFLGDGTRLQSGKEYYVKPTTEIYMGNRNNLYKFK
ncbi:MAG: FHA domain-containing protein [Roseburia sp.]|nr:FHA domain-containing protein [Roseburia sp.]